MEYEQFILDYTNLILKLLVATFIFIPWYYFNRYIFDKAIFKLNHNLK